MFLRSNNVEDGLGPSKPYTSSGNFGVTSDTGFIEPAAATRSSGAAWIWLRYITSVILLGTILGNLIQSALATQYIPLIIVHAGLALCWFIYFPMMIWFTHTNRDSKQVHAINELIVMLGLIAPNVGSVVAASYQLNVWQRNGTLGTRAAVETEYASLITTLAISSFHMVVLALWCLGLCVKVRKNYGRGRDMRWSMTVHSLIRE